MKSSGLLDFISGELAALGIKGVSIPEPKTADINAARRALSNLDEVRGWTDDQWEQKAMELGMDEGALRRLFAELSGGGELRAGATVTTREGRGN